MVCPAQAVWKKEKKFQGYTVGLCWLATKTSVSPRGDRKLGVNNKKKPFPPQRALLLTTCLRDPPPFKPASVGCPSGAEWCSCFTALAVLSSAPPHNQRPLELGHLSHWTRYIEMIHGARASRVATG